MRPRRALHAHITLHQSHPHNKTVHPAVLKAMRITASSADIKKFVIDNNRIEGILRKSSLAELKEFQRFLALDKITVEELESFVSVYAPDAKLRDTAGLNVRVGNHQPPPGGPNILIDLEELLDDEDLSPYEQHIAYETLHPFTDGNGRSGRALWAWRMREFPLGFLHHFYFCYAVYGTV